MGQAKSSRVESSKERHEGAATGKHSATGKHFKMSERFVTSKHSAKSENSATSKRSATSKHSAASPSETVLITPDLLRRMPLPQPDEEDDKEARGRAFIFGGSTEMPGAVVLAATAALRAGAGKVRVATVESVAQLVAAQLLEGRVYSLTQTKAKRGGLGRGARETLERAAEKAAAALIGPGMIAGIVSTKDFRRLLMRLRDVSLVLDAFALELLARLSKSKRTSYSFAASHPRVVLTPNAEEMSELICEPLSAVRAEPRRAACAAADRYGAVVALKGRETLIAAPRSTTLYVNRAGNVGLATSGSGDVLAGLIAGLAARGADPLTAAVWGVYAHALAGERLARRIGRIGYLARELLDEIPNALNEVAGAG
jgi:ADP-dependent NAD(P)H-hydrate dehydratase